MAVDLDALEHALDMFTAAGGDMRAMYGLVRECRAARKLRAAWPKCVEAEPWRGMALCGAPAVCIDRDARPLCTKHQYVFTPWPGAADALREYDEATR